MLKKSGLMFLILGLILAVTSLSAQAIPLVGDYEGIYFNNAETLFDADNSGSITVGDVFWGILDVQNIKGPTDPAGAFGPQIWHIGQTPAEITGYFAAEVTGTVPNGGPGGITDLINFGTPTSDPNGILNTAGGEVFRIYEGNVRNFNDSNQSTGLTTATDGTHLWSLGLGASTDGDSTSGYWYSFAPITPPGPNSPVGDSYAGLNFITPGGEGFLAIDDPNETALNQLIELWFNSEIFQVYALGALDQNGVPYFEFSSNDPAVLHPVPEPATMLLLGVGLIGLAGLGRKKFFKKS